MERLEKEMMHIPIAQGKSAGDFTMLVRMMHNLKVTNCLFLEIFI